MSSVKELHHQAMRLAEKAFIARNMGDYKTAEKFAREAFVLEARAAEQIPVSKGNEPTRSILYRSAASLAYQGRKLYEAQRLAAQGLAGYPSPQTTQELKGLLDQISFELNLLTQNVRIEPEEFQLTMNGASVGWGLIPYDELIRRIQTIRSLIDRTSQRLMGRNYQRRGRISTKYRSFWPAISTPKAGSFSISIRLMKAEAQQMPLLFSASDLIGEIIQGIDMVNGEEYEKLRKQIKDEVYYRNFIAAVKVLAPDGEKIRVVNFAGARISASLTKTGSAIALPVDNETDGEEKKEPITVTGKMDYADSRSQNMIGLTDENGKHYDIHVSEGMEDLVRSYFGELVIVRGLTQDKKKIYPIDIHSADS